MTTLIACALIACGLLGAYCLTRPTESLCPKDRCPYCGAAGTATLDPDDDGTLLWTCPRCARRWVSIEGAPVPGADIPDEAVEAAMAALYATDTPTDKDMRAALAAADAKRAELDGGKARMDTAGEWVQRIDREKAKIIGWVAYRSGGDLDDVVDAVLDALPDLMKGESDE